MRGNYFYSMLIIGYIKVVDQFGWYPLERILVQFINSSWKTLST